MNYDSTLWAIEREVILEVANFKEECLGNPEGWEGEKEISKICWSKVRIAPVVCNSMSVVHTLLPGTNQLWNQQGRRKVRKSGEGGK